MFAKRSSGKNTSLPPSSKISDRKKEIAARWKILKSLIDESKNDDLYQLYKQKPNECFLLIQHQLFSLENHLKIKGNSKMVKYELIYPIHALKMMMIFLPDMLHQRWQFNAIFAILGRMLHKDNYQTVRQEAVGIYVIWLEAMGNNISESCLNYLPVLMTQQTSNVILDKNNNYEKARISQMRNASESVSSTISGTCNPKINDQSSTVISQEIDSMFPKNLIEKDSATTDAGSEDASRDSTVFSIEFQPLNIILTKIEQFMVLARWSQKNVAREVAIQSYKAVFCRLFSIIFPTFQSECFMKKIQQNLQNCDTLLFEERPSISTTVCNISSKCTIVRWILDHIIKHSLNQKYEEEVDVKASQESIASLTQILLSDSSNVNPTDEIPKQAESTTLSSRSYMQQIMQEDSAKQNIEKVCSAIYQSIFDDEENIDHFITIIHLIFSNLDVEFLPMCRMVLTLFELWLSRNVFPDKFRMRIHGVNFLNVEPVITNIGMYIVIFSTLLRAFTFKISKISVVTAYLDKAILSMNAIKNLCDYITEDSESFWNSLISSMIKAHQGIISTSETYFASSEVMFRELKTLSSCTLFSIISKCSTFMIVPEEIFKRLFNVVKVSEFDVMYASVWMKCCDTATTHMGKKIFNLESRASLSETAMRHQKHSKVSTKRSAHLMNANEISEKIMNKVVKQTIRSKRMSYSLEDNSRISIISEAESIKFAKSGNTSPASVSLKDNMQSSGSMNPSPCPDSNNMIQLDKICSAEFAQIPNICESSVLNSTPSSRSHSDTNVVLSKNEHNRISLTTIVTENIIKDQISADQLATSSPTPLSCPLIDKTSSEILINWKRWIILFWPIDTEFPEPFLELVTRCLTMIQKKLLSMIDSLNIKTSVVPENTTFLIPPVDFIPIKLMSFLATAKSNEPPSNIAKTSFWLIYQFVTKCSLFCIDKKILANMIFQLSKFLKNDSGDWCKVILEMSLSHDFFFMRGHTFVSPLFMRSCTKLLDHMDVSTAPFNIILAIIHNASVHYHVGIQSFPKNMYANNPSYISTDGDDLYLYQNLRKFIYKSPEIRTRILGYFYLTLTAVHNIANLTFNRDEIMEFSALLIKHVSLINIPTKLIHTALSCVDTIFKMILMMRHSILDPCKYLKSIIESTIALVNWRLENYGLLDESTISIIYLLSTILYQWQILYWTVINDPLIFISQTDSPSENSQSAVAVKLYEDVVTVFVKIAKACQYPHPTAKTASTTSKEQNVEEGASQEFDSSSYFGVSSESQSIPDLKSSSISNSISLRRSSRSRRSSSKAKSIKSVFKGTGDDTKAAVNDIKALQKSLLKIAHEMLKMTFVTSGNYPSISCPSYGNNIKNIFDMSNHSVLGSSYFATGKSVTQTFDIYPTPEKSSNSKPICKSYSIVRDSSGAHCWEWDTINIDSVTSQEPSLTSSRDLIEDVRHMSRGYQYFYSQTHIRSSEPEKTTILFNNSLSSSKTHNSTIREVQDSLEQLIEVESSININPPIDTDLTTFINLEQCMETKKVPKLKTNIADIFFSRIGAILNPKTNIILSDDKFDRTIAVIDKNTGLVSFKAAVIYVAPEQEDSKSILSNKKGSLEYEKFVSQLGLEVELSSHSGYTGGLSKNGSTGKSCPYLRTPNCEIIFHVSTRMAAFNDKNDHIPIMRHIGNDEIHIVWNENWKSYHRNAIKTEFADLIIVITPLMNGLYKINIKKKSIVLFVGPLYDGAVVSAEVLPFFIQQTVISTYRSLKLKICLSSAYGYENRNKIIESVCGQQSTSSNVITSENMWKMFCSS